MSNSGHHDCSTKAVFLCRADPSHKHNRFQYMVPSHIESCAAYSAGVRGSEAKNPAFCNGRQMAKKTQVQ